MEEATGNACILLLDLPISTFCGIDLLSFSTSAKFKGIRRVPNGWHFLFTGVNDAFSLRRGVWININAQSQVAPELLVKKWDASREELTAEIDETALLQTRANLGSIWREGLTPYRQSASNAKENGAFEEEAHDWKNLTSCISETLLSRIVGTPGSANHWALTSASSAKADADIIPGLTEKEYDQFREKDLNFLPIDLQRTWRDGAVGRERTVAAQDRSWAFEDLIAQSCDGDPRMIIGELQFAFLMVLTLNNNSCLEQWKRLLGLLLTCKSAVPRRSAFFVQVLRLLQLQLDHCQDAEGGLFDMSDDEGNLLKVLLKRFRQGVHEYDGDSKADVMDELDDLEEYLNTEYGWHMNESQVRRGTHQLEDGEEIELEMTGLDEDEELGEYAPTIVELTPEQASQMEGQDNLQLTFNPKLLPSKEQDKRDVPDGNSSDEDELDFDTMDARF